MGATSDPVTVPSCTGSLCDGVCTPSFLNSLPCLFQSTAQTVATLTQSNNQVKVAQINAQAQTQVAGIRAQSSAGLFNVLTIGLVAVVIFAFINRG